MDPCCAFWPAGRRSIVRGAPSAPFTKSISPIDAKQTVSNERFEVDERIEEKGKGGEEESVRKEDEERAVEERRKEVEEERSESRVRREQPGASSQKNTINHDTTEILSLIHI